MKVLHLCIFTNEPLPLGMGATNRLLTYAKGLVENGNKVFVLTFKPNGIKNKSQLNSSINNVDYYITSKSCTWELNYFKRTALLLYSLYNYVSIFINENKKIKISAIILVTTKIYLILLAKCLSLIYRIPLIQEHSEYPFVLIRRKKINLFFSIFFKLKYKLFDGMIVISETLKIFYSQFTKINCSYIVLPILVDNSRFQLSSEPKNEYGNYIAYCGNMSGNKDGLLNLLETFINVHNRFKDINLVLVGTGHKNDLDKLKLFIKKNKIEPYVIFTGYLSGAKLINSLSAAKLLILSRPNDIQAQGGLPTKLGEYLATGQPVVVTKVGEISRYINDEEHAYLVEPDNNKALAEKINQIFDNYESAIQVGRRGKILSETVFSYKVQSLELEKFIKEVCYESS